MWALIIYIKYTQKLYHVIYSHYSIEYKFAIQTSAVYIDIYSDIVYIVNIDFNPIYREYHYMSRQSGNIHIHSRKPTDYKLHIIGLKHSFMYNSGIYSD